MACKEGAGKVSALEYLARRHELRLGRRWERLLAISLLRHRQGCFLKENFLLREASLDQNWGVMFFWALHAQSQGVPVVLGRM